ncbi:MAG: 30S ribosomal protein S3 [Candidatus Diapherotrites archaeon]|nr:30S ribosomal protein S3 [Candidatus Diapherotrites archaeon]
MIERFFIEQSFRKIELERFFKKQLEMAGFTHLDIVKTPLVTRIVLYVTRPGLAIGKGGQTINQLTEQIGKRFKIENPQIEIQEIKRPDLDARANVDKMVTLLERGYSWRSVAFRTMTNIMNGGAQGAELVLAGKLAGKGGRKRKQRVAQGYMKKVGNQVSFVDYAKATAYPKSGAIGIKLRIIPPEVVFPDKIDIKQAIEKEKPAQETAVEETAVEKTEKKEVAEEKHEKKEEKKPISKTAKKKKKAQKKDAKKSKKKAKK